MSAITEDELEAFHAAQREAGRAASTLNHQVQVLTAAFRWAARKGYVRHSPISEDSALKRSKLAKRQRRLFPAEEAALLAVAGPAGQDYPLDAFVFGELGERGGSIKKAWESAVLKAHGVSPRWVRSKLSAECRAHLQRIDLHFHDLRREAASRWHEGGFQLHEVRDLIGHANVSQTDTYLGAKIAGLRTKMEQFDAARGKSVANPPAIEHRPVGQAEEAERRKDQLH